MKQQEEQETKTWKADKIHNDTVVVWKIKS